MKTTTGVLNFEVKIANILGSNVHIFPLKSDNVGISQSTPQSKFEINGALASTIIKVIANIILDNSASVYYFLDKVEATLPDLTTCANRLMFCQREMNNVQILGYGIETLDGTSLTEIPSVIATQIISEGFNRLQT